MHTSPLSSPAQPPRISRGPASFSTPEPTPPATRDEPLDLASAFLACLHPELARTEPQRNEVHRLRHQVYCEELRFEPLRPDGRETDPFDPRSVYCMVLHRRSGVLAGTVRLVGKHHAGEQLPMEAHCAHGLTRESLLPRHFPPHEVCEISRLAVPPRFRKQRAEPPEGASALGQMGFSAEELRTFPYIAVGLYLSAIAMARHTGRFHMYAVMEPRLARGLGFAGIRFERLGPVIEYHGQRAAYHLDSRIGPQGLAPQYQALLQRIEARLFPAETARGGASGLWPLRGRALGDVRPPSAGATTPSQSPP